VESFLAKQCLECHDTATAKGGFDLEQLRWDPASPENQASWIKVHDRVGAGEMPPAKKPRPDAASLRSFTNAVGSALLSADRKRVAIEGRASTRRLNRLEYEDTLRDLLSLPALEVKAFLPEDREAHGFNKIGEALDVSHVQMARYLSAAEFALHQAVAPQATQPPSTVVRYHTWAEREFTGRIPLEGPLNRRTFPLVGLELQRDLMKPTPPKMEPSTNAARRELESMAVVVSTYEPTEIRFGGFRAPYSGRYRLRFSGYSMWMAADFKSVSKSRRSEPVSIYAETPPRSLRKLGSFDFAADPGVQEIEAWLLAGETIRPDAARLFRSRPPDHKNPLAGPDGMPGVAFQWMEVEGPLFDAWPPAGHRLLFGDLAMTNRPAAPSSGEHRRRFQPAPGVEVIPSSAETDTDRLVRRFLERAYRRPVGEADVRRFSDLARSARASGSSFGESLFTAYTAVLSSPAFLYLEEPAGRLDDLSLATRLSLFLWNSGPDEELRSAAARGTLHRPAVLRRQTERLLNDPRSSRFVADFLDYWLDLRLIAGTAPDEELYPDYQLDDLLAESMTEETQRFFGELLRRDLGAVNLVASDFAMLNERLATHYGIPGVEGVGFRPVRLPPGSVRGGLLTQASVLKVTANGTATSPIKRGAWIMTRLVGKPPPPPPVKVAAVDPDIRGATTIREQLARHRNQESCNACHKLIDPAGFALESFDVMGAWRDRYRVAGGGERVKGIGHNGNQYHFGLGPAVDPHGELPDGRPFADVRQLRECLRSDPGLLARNLTQQLAIYATGAPLRFSDRPVITKILADCRPGGYGVRSLVHALVQSDLFLNK
jgi:hypothetical protein